MQDLDRLIATLVRSEWTPAEITALLADRSVPQPQMLIAIARHQALHAITTDLDAAFDRVLRALEALRAR
jgi:hypothetical protein